jgi:hypothetical protein
MLWFNEMKQLQIDPSEVTYNTVLKVLSRRVDILYQCTMLAYEITLLQ